MFFVRAVVRQFRQIRSKAVVFPVFTVHPSAETVRPTDRARSSGSSQVRPMRILRTAFTIFILDGLYPMVINFNRLGWNAPRRVMQSVAAGVLGKASFDGGIPTALLGTALHFTIATIWTSIFAFVVLRLPIVQRLTQTTKGTAVVGATYGGFIWL